MNSLFEAAKRLWTLQSRHQESLGPVTVPEKPTYRARIVTDPLFRLRGASATSGGPTIFIEAVIITIIT